jgi:hypothetical protein
LLAVCALMWAAAASPGPASAAAGDDATDATNSLENNGGAFAAPAATAPADALSVGPGRVMFQLSPTGRWLTMAPEWGAGVAVVTGGGFVVMAVGEDGVVVELANTATGGDRLRAAEGSRNLRPVYEGIAGGVRYPLEQRDDDGDGRENEDRLDGLDNDGDGRVDEDFAAAGDQMIAMSYDALDDEDRLLLQLHQECYTWTLPHIDGMVAMKLVVRNASDRAIDGVRVGVVIRRPEGFAVATQNLAPDDRDGERLVSKGILSSEPGRTAVAGLFFAEPVSENDSWLTGITSGGRHLADLVQTVVAAQRGGEMEDIPRSESTTESPLETQPNERIAYGVSPDLGRLEPGDETVVYAAVVAVPSIDRVDRAIEDAYRTVIGDGTHRMVPPPVSVKRWTVWGTYKTQHAAGNAPAEVTITLENARGNGIGAGDISYLTGIDLSRVELREVFNGDLELVLDGELYSEIAGIGNRVELHGRLRNGELFDVVLTPVDTGQRSGQINGLTEAQYWTRPGKLDEEFLAGSPNPFRESTTIFYEVPSAVSNDEGSSLSFVNPIETSVKIYNVAGRLVSVLVDAILSPGRYDTSWNGVDDSGNGVASGVYYVKLQIGKKHVTKRLIQLK